VIDQRKLLGASYAAALQAPEVYQKRRQRLVQLLGSKGVAVLLGVSDTRSYGDVGTLRQEPNFFYLSGVELPNAALLLSQGRDELYVPPRQANLEAWTGPRFGPGEEAAKALGFAAVRSRQAGEKVVEARVRPVPGFEEELASLLAEGHELWMLLPPPSASGPVTPELELVGRLRARLPSFVLKDLTPLLRHLRVKKDEGELELLREAVRITAEGLRAAAAALAPQVTEAALEGAVYAAFRRQGAEGWAFPPIVGAGFAGCVLHYDQNAGLCQEGELVVVDVGARFGYYCGDLTRTFPVSGRFSPRQAQLYDAVVAAYEAALAFYRPGGSLAQARHAAYQSLQDSGLKGDGGKPLSEFFIHGIGHFLGLETHDLGLESQPFEPGMVVTLEPGVYLQEEGIGIRIEDDYLITEEGATCLTPSWLARHRLGVEALVGAPSGA
jgi:Xaa-Pro aminopeptidase